MKCFEIDTAVCIERINQAKYILKAISDGDVSATMCCLEEFKPEVDYLRELCDEMRGWTTREYIKPSEEEDFFDA